MSLGMGVWSLGSRAEAQAYFVDAVGRMMGVISFSSRRGFDCNGNGVILGAVGISGDTSDNDEAAAVAAIRQLA